MSGVKRTKSNVIDKNGTFATSNGDSIGKVPDSTSMSEGDNLAVEKFIGENVRYFQYMEVRFTPSVLKFINAFQGKQFCEKLTIQNVGRNPISIRIGEPTSFIFQMKRPSRRIIFLAAGASVTRKITYTYHSDDLVQESRIPIYINGKQFDYPIVVKKAMPELEVQPTKINFGTINLGSEVKTLVLTIRNTGGTRSKYEIDLGKNDLDLVVNPIKGTIKAKHQVKVTVEIMGTNEGEFYSEIWIKTNEAPIRVPVLIEVLRPRLLVVYPNGTDELSVIDFPPTFCGTQKAVPFILKNRSGEITLFITVGEVNGEHQFLNEARKNHESLNFFSLSAEEGRLESHECRVLTALFRPDVVQKTKGWHHQEKARKKPQSEYVVFFMISRVHCIERREIERVVDPFYLTENQKSSLSLRIRKESSRLLDLVNSNKEYASQELWHENIYKETGFRLCLRGKSVKPEILLQPSKFYFGELSLGRTEQRVLTITNTSIIRVKCVILKKMNVNVVPNQIWIGPEKVHEFSVKVTPTFAGTFHLIVKIQILGESDVVYETDKPFKVIAEYPLSVSFTGVVTTKVPSPKIPLGITPLITNEAGINKELVTFNNADKVPYAAKLLSLTEEFKPMWMRMKSAKMENFMIALPNDRPRGFQTWPKDKICRTIFKGWLRYPPPKNPLYTYSSQEQIVKDQNNAVWANYLLMMREIREAYHREMMDCKEDLSVCYVKRFNEHFKICDCLKSELKIKRKVSNCSLQNSLVPLSPMFLSYVMVEPKMINFGMVAVDSPIGANLKINNKNNFPIAIKFISGNSAVSVNEGTVIVYPNFEKTITVRFRLNVLGRYYGFLNYVINGSHEFKITVSAFVLSMTLIVDRKNLVFSDYPVHKAFQPKSLFLGLENWLQAQISYKLQFSADSPYFAIRDEGEVPPYTKLLTEIVAGLHPSKPLTAELKVISESGEKELLKIAQSYRKLSVGFIRNRIDVKDVPLNLKTKITTIVNNECFHDVTFELINGSPIPGVTVKPKSGVIRARSFFPLNVHIQIPVVMHFTFEIQMIIQNSNRISVKVTGNVVLPDIRIKPSIINMRKICAQSFDTVVICVENAGTTPSEVDFDFRVCPEYKVLKGKSHLYLRPKQAISVDLLFEPKDATRFVFYLPVVINNILGPPMMQEAQTENVCYFLSDLGKMYDVYGDVYDTEKSGEKIPLAILSCTVASNLITVTPSSVTFEQAKNSNSQDGETLEAVDDDGSLYFPPKTIVISNDSTVNVTFCIRNDDLGKSNDSPFDLQPVNPDEVEYRLRSMKATLQPGNHMSFRATFSPKKPGNYTIQAPVYVRGYNDGMVYCYITLSGLLKNPHLIPEANEIHFYPMPLNASSEITFTVTAENFSQRDVISCLICESEENKYSPSESLTITWLEKPEVTEISGRQKFPIRISFRSSVPVALRCYLVFVDSNKNYCSVLVTAVSDNSSITTHSFLNMKSSNYKIIRNNCTSLVWNADEYPVLLYPIDKLSLQDLVKNEKVENKRYDIESDRSLVQLIDSGPNVIVQGTLSGTKIGQVNKKHERKDNKSEVMQNATLTPSATSSACTIKSVQLKPYAPVNEIDITYPNYPIQEGLYKNHCENTLRFVERWIFEVVMRCDQYFMIPTSFMISKNSFKSTQKAKTREQKNVIHFLEEIFENDVIPGLQDINKNEPPLNWVTRLFTFYNDILRLLESHGCFLPHVSAEYLLPYDEYCFFVTNIKSEDIVKPINVEIKINTSKKFSQNALHVKLKPGTDEFQFQKTSSNTSGKDWFVTKSVLEELTMPFDVDVGVEKEDNLDFNDKPAVESHSKPAIIPDPSEEFHHRYDVLEEPEFYLRSTQAWLDIIIQLFRHVILEKIVYKSTIPEVLVIEPHDKVPPEIMEMNKVSFYGGGKKPMTDIYSSDLYNVQERMLLHWLNHHLNLQREKFWSNISGDLIPPNKFINNFHKDLCDSVALISVTASYGPFLIPEYFHDCFPKPDSPGKLYHNAARLVQAWREVNIGLTVETTDIVEPNSVFMVMLVAQLYEMLPALHPRYLVCFEASLSSNHAKKFSLQSNVGKVVLQPKILGEDRKYFRLKHSSLLELRKGKAHEIKVTFLARKIKKVKATLLLTACEESPNFGKSLTFLLDGQLKELAESEKLSFSAPLYKVICTEIPIKSPYSDSSTYEIWYSTVKPALTETKDLVNNSKPWSMIRFRKVCRRLFLNKNELNFIQNQKKAFLSITVGCFTEKERLFWLLFRSKTGDFLVRIKIKTKIEKGPFTTLDCWYPNTSSVCSCAKTDKDPRINWTDMTSCPLLTVIRVPSRNDALWESLLAMFMKSVRPQEKEFWTEHFGCSPLEVNDDKENENHKIQTDDDDMNKKCREMDMGLCIIRWLLSTDEEEEVVNEFVPLLETDVKYKLTVIGSKKDIKLPPEIEIKDVRVPTDIVIPIHISNGLGKKTEVDMKSESEMEVRRFDLKINSLKQTEEEENEEPLILKGMCQPCATPLGICKKSKSFAKLY